MNDPIIPLSPEPGDNRSGEQRIKDARVVQDVLKQTGDWIDNSPPAETEEDKAFRRLAIANRAVLEAVHKYHQDHPLVSNTNEVRKLVMSIYALEFCKWSKDDVIFMLTVQQTQLALKKLGYRR